MFAHEVEYSVGRKGGGRKEKRNGEGKRKNERGSIASVGCRLAVFGI